MVVNRDAGLRRWTWAHPVGPRWLLRGDIGFDDSHDDVPLALCADIEGLFVDTPADGVAAPVPEIRLLDCRPEPALLVALGALGQSSRAGLRRRRIRGEVHAVATDGSTGLVIGAGVSGTVNAAGPSRSVAGLLDVTVELGEGERLPVGVLGILEHWRTGRPSRRNLWAGYDRDMRHRWAGVALGHLSGAPDGPPGTTYDLDGRFVTDIEGFYCALGEAINGPGGYFGWNLDALEDCLRGGFGAQAPFHLVWHESAVAREHLAAGYDRRRLGPAITREYLLDMLAKHRIEIDLR
ncbi:barstar family protein [Amycolatopsis sp. EV170708-02-1]|uniref:barstar family protein n=1 Tax=Amycolatopsis sp. EV170708-02-1 TaxID=2919322 RepID=UPI001F0C9E18|nr:barstar family protein [Amycolatopsis sp. EV170708-02-1]UMP04910.1 barstar family protein [Amycolatopsis sp. EV170708-02-1]